MVELIPLPTIATLEPLWKAVAAQADHSFFLSWHWIGTWIQCLPRTGREHLLQIREDGEIVGLAVIIAGARIRHGILPVQTLSLNATGDQCYDCICVEYNGLLVRPIHAEAAWKQALSYLRQRRGWDELDLQGVPLDLLTSVAASDFHIRVERHDCSRFTDLEAVRKTASGSCLQLLGSSTRSRLRQTQRLLREQLGPIRLDVATDVSTALVYLENLKNLHEKRWGQSEDGGAFRAPFFEVFHRQLIERCFHAGAIQMARFSAGETVLGFFYNFVHDGIVSFYQSGIDYEAVDRNASPGLLLHAELIDFNAANGHRVYDFLAGDGQYKRSLSTHVNPLFWGAVQMPRAKLRAERAVGVAYSAVKRQLRKLDLIPRRTGSAPAD